MQLPTLRTARLLMQPFQAADVDVLHALWTDADVRRHLWDDEVISRDRARSTVEAVIDCAAAAGIGMWTLREAGVPDVVIGFSGLRYLRADGEVELLYGLLPRFWRRGLATEASAAVLRYVFAELRLSRVFAGADQGNERSFGVMQRLGMTRVPDGIADVPGAVYYAIAADAFVRRQGTET